jgi:flagellar L-ring protein precursor FlgH
MIIVITLLFVSASFGADRKSALDEYIERVQTAAAAAAAPNAGSLWAADAPLGSLGRDLRAAKAGDIVTIAVLERASATTSGTVQSNRSSSASASIDALGGATRAAGPLARLANLGGNSQLKGEGATSRETFLTTTLSGHVSSVLPNGALVIEACKSIGINAERQLVCVRGIGRPADLGSGNVISSDRLAQLEVDVNGKGVVGDAIRRPFFLYRLLLGLLPF